MKENYERWMNREIQRFQARGEVPRLLLHSCCAPCSSAVLESVFRYFEITVLYYNPNIFPKEEYLHRVQEQKRFLAQFPPASSVTFLEGDYQPERFFQLAQGLEQEPEGGERCARCYELRLRRTAELARELGFSYFTTTLSISPYKDAEKLNAIGGSSLRNTRFLTYILILKRRTAISFHRAFQGIWAVPAGVLRLPLFPGRSPAEKAGAGKPVA